MDESSELSYENYINFYILIEKRIQQLKKFNFLGIYKERSLKHLFDITPETEVVHETLIDNLAWLVEEQPQEIINYVRNTIRDTSTITKILTSLPLKKNDLKSKMKIIEILWETSSQFKFLAFILSKGKNKTENFTKPEQIYKYFKMLGLTSQQVQEMRIIRNMSCHKFHLDGQFLVQEYEGKLERIEIEKIEPIFDKVYSISILNINFLLSQLLFMPVFGALALYAVITDAKNNMKEIGEYFNSILQFLDEEIRAQIEKQQEEMKNKPDVSDDSLQNKQAMHELITSLSSTVRQNSEILFNTFILVAYTNFEDVIEIVKSLLGQTNRQLSRLSYKLKNKKDRVSFFKAKNWIEAQNKSKIQPNIPEIKNFLGRYLQETYPNLPLEEIESLRKSLKHKQLSE